MEQAEAAQSRTERWNGASDAEEDGLRLIGWRERVAFPEWGVAGVLTKIDTGACVSALHVADIERLEGDRVSFHVALDRKLSKMSERIEAKLHRETKIRSSNGQLQHRYVVGATIDVGGVRKEIEVSLVCRKSMRCRMLLGREGLSGTFVVDPSRDYVLTSRPEKPPRKPRVRKRKSKAGSSGQENGAAGGAPGDRERASKDEGREPNV